LSWITICSTKNNAVTIIWMIVNNRNTVEKNDVLCKYFQCELIHLVRLLQLKNVKETYSLKRNRLFKEVKPKEKEKGV
jgi:hypothetical protein